MRKEIEIVPAGEQYRLICRGYRGRFEGEAIGRRLELVESESPAEETDDTLEIDHYYLWRPMSREPVLHALIAGDRLAAVAELAHDLHYRVAGGGELLPMVTDRPERARPESPAQVIEQHHRSAISRGPRAVLTAVLVRLVPAVVVLAIGMLLVRHVGDPHRPVSLTTLFERAAGTPPSRSLVDRIVSPDHWSNVRCVIADVRFLDGNRMIIQDGHFLEVRGIDRLRPVFEDGYRLDAPPHLDAHLADGRVVIDRLTVGNREFGTGGELVLLHRFDPSDSEPRRSPYPAEFVFQKLGKLRYDDDEIEALVGRRVSVEARIVEEDGRLVLRRRNGAGVALRAVHHAPLAELLGAFTGDASPLQFDLVLKSTYSRHLRRETQLVGEAEVYSASAQNFHIIGRR